MRTLRGRFRNPVGRLVAVAGVALLVAFVFAGMAAAKGPGEATKCEGSFGGEAENLVVPAKTTCTLESTAKIAHNVTVEPEGSLRDEGASIGGSLQANNAVGVQISGGSIGHDVQITGLTGSIEGADNTVCNATIGHDLHIEHAAASAAAIVVGDPPCSAGVEIAHDIHVQNNADKVDVSQSSAGHDIHVQNNTGGVFVGETTSGHDLHVQNNKGGVVVSNNKAGHNAKCSHNEPTTEGENNTQTKGKSKGCPAPLEKPAIKKVDPNKGKTEGGQAVKIQGSGFTGAKTVKFGSTEVAFTVVSDKEIKTTSPVSAEEVTVDVTVTNAVGTSAITNGDHFTYTNH